MEAEKPKKQKKTEGLKVKEVDFQLCLTFSGLRPGPPYLPSTAINFGRKQITGHALFIRLLYERQLKLKCSF